MAKTLPVPLGVLTLRPKVTKPGTFEKPQTTGQKVQKPVEGTDDAQNSLKREVESATTAPINGKSLADIHTTFSWDLRGALEAVTDVKRKLDPTTTTNEVIHELFKLKLSTPLSSPRTTQQQPSKDAIDIARRRRASRTVIRERHTKGQLRLPSSLHPPLPPDSLQPNPGFKFTIIPNPSHRAPIHQNLPPYLPPPPPLTASHMIVEEPTSPATETGNYVTIHYRRVMTDPSLRAITIPDPKTTSSDHGSSANVSNGSFTWDASIIARAAHAANNTTEADTDPDTRQDLTDAWKLDLAHLPPTYQQFKTIITSRVWHGVLGRPVSVKFEIWRARGVWREGGLKGWDCVGEIPFSSSSSFSSFEEGSGANEGDERGCEMAVWRGFSVSEVYDMFRDEAQGVKLDLEEKSKVSGWQRRAGWDEWVLFSSQDVVGRVIVAFEKVSTW